MSRYSDLVGDVDHRPPTESCGFQPHAEAVRIRTDIRRVASAVNDDVPANVLTGRKTRGKLEVICVPQVHRRRNLRNGNTQVFRMPEFLLFDRHGLKRLGDHLILIRVDGSSEVVLSLTDRELRILLRRCGRPDERLHTKGRSVDFASAYQEAPLKLPGLRIVVEIQAGVFQPSLHDDLVHAVQDSAVCDVNVSANRQEFEGIDGQDILTVADHLIPFRREVHVAVVIGDGVCDLHPISVFVETGDVAVGPHDGDTFGVYRLTAVDPVVRLSRSTGHEGRKENRRKGDHERETLHLVLKPYFLV